jgi:phosphoesterase RecJ-like protein
MISIRRKRVAEQIQSEISALLIKGLKDPRIGFVTITGVELSPDFRKAWVYFCTPGSEDAREQSQAGLQSASGFIRKTLGKRLRLKNIPEFQFKYDSCLDEGNKIECILNEVREKEGWDDPSRQRGTPEEIVQAIESSNRILIATHTNPDGDAIASVLALGHLLTKMGKEVVMYNQDRVPGNFMFLPGADRIVPTITGEFDATMVLDCSELHRTGTLLETMDLGTLVSIDHHLTTQPLGEYYYLDPESSSIGEMLYHVAKHLPVDLDFESAMCIYTSILSDTGSFRYSNTKPATMTIAAEMLSLGVSPWEVSLHVYESQPVARLELLALVLKTLKVELDGRFATIVITKQMMEETSTSPDLLDGLINYPRGIAGVEVALQIREIEANSYKVSFRSRGNINVAEIAQEFGGGGHANAAGCALYGSLETVRERMRQAVQQFLDAYDLS